MPDQASTEVFTKGFTVTPIDKYVLRDNKWAPRKEEVSAYSVTVHKHYPAHHLPAHRRVVEPASVTKPKTRVATDNHASEPRPVSNIGNDPVAFVKVTESRYA